MGWGRTLLLGDIGNRLDIGDCEQDLQKLAAALRSQASEDQALEARLGALEAENRELKLYLAAVIRLLISRGAVDADEFARLVDAVDRSDGQADGQFSGDVARRDVWTGSGQGGSRDEPQGG